MSMFMASMRNAMRDGELDDMGMFGAALKADVVEYERKWQDDADRRRFVGATASTTSDSGNEQVAVQVEGEGSRDALNPSAQGADQ